MGKDMPTSSAALLGVQPRKLRFGDQHQKVNKRKKNKQSLFACVGGQELFTLVKPQPLSLSRRTPLPLWSPGTGVLQAYTQLVHPSLVAGLG